MFTNVADQNMINSMIRPAELPTPVQSTVIISSVDNSLPRSDRAALDLGLKTVECSLAVCCPSDDHAARRYAWAAGARLFLTPDEIPAGLVIAGLGGGRFSHELFLAQLAVKLQAELILEVLTVCWSDGLYEVVRDLGRGVQEKLRIPPPLVLGISAQAVIAKYVSRHRLVSAHVPQLPHNTYFPPDIMGEKIEWQPTRKRPKTLQVAAKTAANAQSRMDEAFGLSSLSTTSAAASAGNRVVASPQECANHLIRYLVNFGFLDLNQIDEESDSSDHLAGSAGKSSAYSDPMSKRIGEKLAASEQTAVDVWSMRTHATGFVRSFPQPIRPAVGQSDGRTDEELMKRLARRPRPYGIANDSKLLRRPRPLDRTNWRQLARGLRHLKQ